MAGPVREQPHQSSTRKNTVDGDAPRDWRGAPFASTRNGAPVSMSNIPACQHRPNDNAPSNVVTHLSGQRNAIVSASDF
jgi:hypothetical protein